MLTAAPLDSCDQKYLDAVTAVYSPEAIAHSGAWPTSTTSERVNRLSAQDREFLADLLTHIDVRSMLDLIVVKGSVAAIRGEIDIRKLPLNTACALMAIANGAQFPAMTADAVEETEQPAVTLDCLTIRQRDVLAQMTAGFSNKEIGNILDLTEGTTKIHVSAIMKALGVKNRTQAAMIGRRLLGITQQQGA